MKLALLALLAFPALAGNGIFEKDTLHEIHLTLPAADWQRLKREVEQNTWFTADFRWNGEHVPSVGLRSRGGQWSRDEKKPGLKIEFGRHVKNQRFQGLDSLALDNNSQDPTHLSEFLASQVFARHGIPAPRVAHARLLVNGEYAGLYSVIEPIDKAFLASRFAAADGDLYEYQWREEWRFEQRRSYAPELFEPRTNKKTFDAAAVSRLMAAIQGGKSAEIGAHLGLERAVRYIAVENALGEIDGLLGESGVNNVYLYRAPGGFLFLPWDKDSSFRDPAHSIWKSHGDFLLSRALFESDELRELYLGTLKEVVDASVNEAWLLPEIGRAEKRIRASALADPLAESFDAKIRALKSFARKRKAAVQEQISSGK